MVFFVILLGLTVIYGSRYFEVSQSIWTILKAVTSGKFFLVG